MNMHREDQVNDRPKKARSTTRRKAVAADAGAQAGPEQRNRHRLLWLLLLLLPFSFWLGRVSVTQPVVSAPAAATITPAATTMAGAAKAPRHAGLSKLAESVSRAASSIITHPRHQTALLEVSVGTSRCGGLTLTFDHPVQWATQNPADGRAEVDVAGVRALGTFPRNLPLPPGVDAIHAGITAPDMLNLKFDLKPGFQAYTLSGNGPSATVDVYFRASAGTAASGAVPSGGLAGGGGSCGSADLAAARL